MMTSIDFPRTLPPTSSTAMRAASAEVLPPKSAYGPDWSLRIPMRTTPLGLCASATLLRNTPTQNTPIKGEYRIDASQRCKTWHIFRRVQRDRATCKKRVSKGTTSPRGPLGATTAAIFVQHEDGQS